MSATYIDKQPHEAIPIAVSFVNRLPTGETLQNSSHVTVTAVSSGVDYSALATDLDIASPIMAVTFSNGSHGEDYKVSFFGVTQNYTYEYDVFVQCREV